MRNMKKVKVCLIVLGTFTVMGTLFAYGKQNPVMHAATNSFQGPNLELYDEVYLGDQKFSVVDQGSTVKLLSQSESAEGKTFAEAENSLNTYKTSFGTLGNKAVGNTVRLPKSEDLTTITEADSSIIENGKKLNAAIPTIASDWWLGDESTNNRSKFVSSDNKLSKETTITKTTISNTGVCGTEEVKEYGQAVTETKKDERESKLIENRRGKVSLNAQFTRQAQGIIYSDEKCQNQITGSGLYDSNGVGSTVVSNNLIDFVEGNKIQPVKAVHESGATAPANSLIVFQALGLKLKPSLQGSFEQIVNRCYNVAPYSTTGYNYFRGYDGTYYQYKSFKSTGSVGSYTYSNLKIVNGSGETKYCEGQTQIASTLSVRPLIEVAKNKIILGNKEKRTFQPNQQLREPLPSSDSDSAYLTLLDENLQVALTPSATGVSGTTLTTTLPDTHILSIPVTVSGGVEGKRYVSAVAEINGVKQYGVLKEMDQASGTVELNVSNFSENIDSLTEIKLTLYQENSGDYKTTYMGNGTEITIKLGKSQSIEFDADQEDTLTYGDTVEINASLTTLVADQADTNIIFSVIEGENLVELTQSYDKTTGKATVNIKPKTGTGTITLAIDKDGGTGVSKAPQKTMEITLGKKNLDIWAEKPNGTFKVDTQMPKLTVRSEGLVNEDKIPETLVPDFVPMDAATPSSPHTSGVIDQIGTWKLIFSDDILTTTDQSFVKKYNITFHDYDEDQTLLFETLPSDTQTPELVVIATVDGIEHPSDTWTKGELIFTIGGGLTNSLRTGYEVAITNGFTPNEEDFTSINDPDNHQHKLTGNVNGDTYWFRAVPMMAGMNISDPYIVKLDNEAPKNVQISVQPKQRSLIEQIMNAITFGNWYKEEQTVSLSAEDNYTPQDKITYYYAEELDGEVGEWKEYPGELNYGDTDIILHAKAVDLAGNESEEPVIQELKIDKQPPVITGVKDKAEYKQYYVPRFFKVADNEHGSGLAKAEYTYNAGTPTDITSATDETKVKDEGTYQIYAKDNAGNEITLTFKIVKLPDIESEINGTDESKEIIDQIQKEYEEVKDKLDRLEKEEYEKWIEEATKKWEDSRRKVVEDDETTSKVEGQEGTTFDPRTELIVEEIPKEEIPTLPRNAIKTYDVYLMKGDTVIQPDGSVKVYLPYTEEPDPIVYEIDDHGTIKEIPTVKENGYVTFVTDKLVKYAISNTEQEEQKPDVCVVGPDKEADTIDDVCGSDDSTKNPDGSVDVPSDGKVIFPDGTEIKTPDGAHIYPDGTVELPDGTEYNPDGTKKDPEKQDPDTEDNVCVAGPDGKLGTNDDVCGNGNGKEEPTKKPNGDVEVPDGGSVIFPGGNEVELPDGGIIHPDGSVTLPDGTEYNPDGTKKDPEKQDPDTEDNVCVAGPDGKLGTNDDVCGSGNGKEEPTKKPNGDVEVPDGGSVIFPGGNEVELPDGGIIHPDGSVTLPDGTEYDPDGTKKDPNKQDPDQKDPEKETCKLEGTVLNKYTDGDGLPDLNIDFNKDTEGNPSDCVADLNIDVDRDGIPDTQIDTDGDGKADINLVAIKKWTPNKDDCVYQGMRYDTMSGLVPNLNIDDDGDGKPDRNIDDDGDGIPDRNVDPDWFDKYGSGTNGKGDLVNNIGGANTGDRTKWAIWWIVFIATSITMFYAVNKRKKQNHMHS